MKTLFILSPFSSPFRVYRFHLRLFHLFIGGVTQIAVARNLIPIVAEVSGEKIKLALPRFSPRAVFLPTRFRLRRTLIPASVKRSIVSLKRCLQRRDSSNGVSA